MRTQTAGHALRGAVFGLGMIGRHHSRLLQSVEGIEFAGAVDRLGDPHGSLADPAQLYGSAAELLETGPLDFAIVAVPTEFHLGMVEELAASGVSVLVEKPVAANTDEAHRLIAACEQAGVKGAVGHVERYNAALREARRRVEAGQIGEVFAVNCERTGPFPDRIRDVGVVKDLATHDVDIAMWMGGAEIASISATTQYRAGRAHEDLVAMSGQLTNGVSISLQVDWLTPAKTRRTRILGEHGMLVADSLTTELSYYENARVRIEWPESQQFKGVSEGDVTRYALEQREPLRLELEAFRDFVAGGDASSVVSLEHGLCVLEAAEAALESARTGATVAVAQART